MPFSGDNKAKRSSPIKNRIRGKRHIVIKNFRDIVRCLPILISHTQNKMKRD